MRRFFPIIHLKGSFFEMGLYHRQSLVKEIRANLSLYIKLIHQCNGLDYEQTMERSRKFLPGLQEAAPILVEEMEGIACGAEVSLDDVLFLNVRTELMSMNAPNGECTTIGLTGERTEEGWPLLAQNWDWHCRIKSGTAIFFLEPAQGPLASVFSEAGQGCKIGLNENGLGVLLNILFSGEVQYGVPVHILLRMVLNAADVPDAVGLVKSAKRASSSHFLLGDIHGNVVGLEFTPKALAEIHPVFGAVIHTNHFCDEKLAENDLGPAQIPHTGPRFKRARTLLSRKESGVPRARRRYSSITMKDSPPSATTWMLISRNTFIWKPRPHSYSTFLQERRSPLTGSPAVIHTLKWPSHAGEPASAEV